MAQSEERPGSESPSRPRPLFGSTVPQGGGLFGSPAPTTITSSPLLFGKVANKETRSTGIGESKETTPDPSSQSREKVLAEGVSVLFKSTKHADVKIHIGKTELPAHALVLSIGSGYFEKAFENGFQEQKTKTFHFGEGYETSHWRVFRYLYTGDYSEFNVESLSITDEKLHMRHAHVYRLADYFQIERLKKLALGRFHQKMRIMWYGQSDEFVDCISEVYGELLGDYNELRQVVVDVVVQNYKGCLGKADLQKYMRENADFTTDVLVKHSETYDSVVKPSNGGTDQQTKSPFSFAK